MPMAAVVSAESLQFPRLLRRQSNGVEAQRIVGTRSVLSCNCEPKRIIPGRGEVEIAEVTGDVYTGTAGLIFVQRRAYVGSVQCQLPNAARVVSLCRYLDVVHPGGRYVDGERDAVSHRGGIENHTLTVREARPRELTPNGSGTHGPQGRGLVHHRRLRRRSRRGRAVGPVQNFLRNTL